MIKPAPRWAVVAAHAVPLVALPSGLWRIGLVTGFPDWYGEHVWTAWERPYVLLLSLVSEGLALLTLGLVRPWGEVVPGWVPLLGGRRIPVAAAVVPAAVGAFLVFTLLGYAALNQLLHLVEPLNDTGEALPNSGPGFWLLLACYLPLFAWGPLLAAVTVAYYRRRRGAGPNSAVSRGFQSVGGSADGSRSPASSASSSVTREVSRWTSWTASR
ncbi:hypothetical protein F4556_006139 [Kitasatospora gansuensis]|uniref:Uncharacterized protein n=1 Tax=Kitasatospora gansuensis TaxID=258050 RepID=A0A7W7SHM4_9ACTN|nr:hypothetical protein [Kitasatospora gansuensis]MBB4950604.1 hypothetical protein [Kitasatospora gansuensis]